MRWVYGRKFILPKEKENKKDKMDSQYISPCNGPPTTSWLLEAATSFLLRWSSVVFSMQEKLICVASQGPVMYLIRPEWILKYRKHVSVCPENNAFEPKLSDYQEVIVRVGPSLQSTKRKNNGYERLKNGTILIIYWS